MMDKIKSAPMAIMICISVAILISLINYFLSTDENQLEYGWEPIENWPKEFPNLDFVDGCEWVGADNPNETIVFGMKHSSIWFSIIETNDDWYFSERRWDEKGLYILDGKKMIHETFLKDVIMRVDNDGAVLFKGTDLRSNIWPNPYMQERIYVFLKWDPYNNTLELRRKYYFYHPIDASKSKYIDLESAKIFKRK